MELKDRVDNWAQKALSLEKEGFKPDGYGRYFAYLAQLEIEEQDSPKIKELREIMTDPGSHPDYHWAQVVKLKKDWPMLFNFIDRTLKEKS